jgi:PKD repeat protein
MDNNMDKKISILRKPFRKMPYFGLYYDINKSIGTFDDEGIPDMVDDIFFTKEEIIIKLFGLKQYIEKRNIGGVSKIIDIIGEANYFNKISYYHHVETSELIANINTALKPNVAINATSGYIKDLREYLYTNNKPVCVLPADATSSSIPDQIYNHFGCIMGFFDNLDVLEENIFSEDNDDIPIGFILKLENKTFDIPVGQIETRIVDLDEFHIPATVQNFTSINYYKLKWEIERDAISDGRKFYHSFTGNISESSRYLECILPYDGKYKINLTIYGYGNNNIYYSYEHIIVDLQKIDSCGFFQEYDEELNVVGKNKTLIKDCDTIIRNTIYRTTLTPERVEDRSFNLASYINLNQYGDINIGVRKDYPVKKIDATIESMAHMRIVDFGYTKERMPDFNMVKVKPGGKISINGEGMTINSGININDFGLLKDQIVAAFPDYYTTLREVDDDPFKFIDIRREEDEIWAGSSNDDDISCIEETFTSVSQIYHKIKDVPVILESANKICHSTLKINPFNRNNVYISSDTMDIHPYTCVFFCDDISPNVGKKNQVWSVFYEEDQRYVTKDIACRHFNYRFEFPGFYTLELTLEDTNGNKYKVTKKNFINVII